MQLGMQKKLQMPETQSCKANTATGAMQPSHPLDVYFNELIARRRAEIDLGRTAAALGDATPPAHTTLAATYIPESTTGMLQAPTTIVSATLVPSCLH
eukprot:1151773-Pelagomonas_calceolata.AAC.6